MALILSAAKTARMFFVKTTWHGAIISAIADGIDLSLRQLD
jgi:hypothetical protein